MKPEWCGFVNRNANLFSLVHNYFITSEHCYHSRFLFLVTISKFGSESKSGDTINNSTNSYVKKQPFHFET